MVCDGCAETIRTALMALPGVHEVNVGLSRKRVRVRYEADRLQEAEIRQAIGSSGFAVAESQHAQERAMRTRILKIEGMRCEGCAATIGGLLTAQPGVRAATVSLKDGEARVLYQPETLGEDQLAALIEKPGYRVVGRE